MCAFDTYGIRIVSLDWTIPESQRSGAVEEPLADQTYTKEVVEVGGGVICKGVGGGG